VFTSLYPRGRYLARAASLGRSGPLPTASAGGPVRLVPEQPGPPERVGHGPAALSRAPPVLALPGLAPRLIPGLPARLPVRPAPGLAPRLPPGLAPRLPPGLAPRLPPGLAP
jgi:hypothetical protein